MRFSIVILAVLSLFSAFIVFAQSDKPASTPATGPTSKPATWSIDPALPAKDLAEYNKKMEELKKEFKFVPMAEWKGMRFIFMPQLKQSQEMGYFDFTGGKGDNGIVTYQEAVGKVGTIIEISTDGFSDNTFKFSLKMDADGSVYKAEGGPYISKIAPVKDIEKAKSLWKSKTVWLLSYPLDKYPMGDKTESFKVSKFSPAKVVDVEAGWDHYRPVRIVLETTKGEKGFYDLSLSGTNCYVESKDEKKRWELDKYLYLEDPHKLYNWDRKTWDAIESGKLLIGMTPDQVILSRGKRDCEIKRTTTAKGTEERWLYSETEILIFENNLLVKIQE